jgi:hypothetical protein
MRFGGDAEGTRTGTGDGFRHSSKVWGSPASKTALVASGTPFSCMQFYSGRNKTEIWKVFEFYAYRHKSEIWKVIEFYNFIPTGIKCELPGAFALARPLVRSWLFV